jgi:DNA-binding beta-propeller fold protein YncE
MTTKNISLRYVKTVGVYNNSSSGRGFANPVDLVVSKDERIFVLGRGEYCRVGVCNLGDEYLYEFGSLGDSDGQFRLASAIALDSQERVYVADEFHNRISVFDSPGTFLGKWGEPGSREGQIDGPSGLVFDYEDNVYVVDQNNHRVQKFAPDGRFLLSWGEHGSGEGQFNMPWGITLDSDGDVYVADWRNDRIQKFSPNGRFVAMFGEPGARDGQFHRPSSVAVDSAGHIYVADWGNERVQILARDGSFLLKLRGQATSSVWAQEFLDANVDEKVPREKANLVPQLPPHLDTPYVISAQTEPYFWGPAVNLDGEDRLYVTESSRHRIQVYQRG